MTRIGLLLFINLLEDDAYDLGHNQRPIPRNCARCVSVWLVTANRSSDIAGKNLAQNGLKGPKRPAPVTYLGLGFGR